MKLLSTNVEPYTTITDPVTNASCQVMCMSNKYDVNGSHITRNVSFYGDGIEIYGYIWQYITPTYHTVNEVMKRFLKDVSDFVK